MSITPKLPRPSHSDVELTHPITKKSTTKKDDGNSMKTEKINTLKTPLFKPSPPLISRPTQSEIALAKTVNPTQYIEMRDFSANPSKSNSNVGINQLLSHEKQSLKQSLKPIEQKNEIVTIPLPISQPVSNVETQQEPNYSQTAAYVNKAMDFTGILRGLSDDQKEVIELAESEISFFFSGAAGTGKSYVMKKLITVLKQLHPTINAVHVTASTGIAACNIGGTTLHSFAGIGLGDQEKEMLYAKVIKNRAALDKWLKAEVILIDEISMISGDLLDKLDYVAKNIKRNRAPFGGIQMIFSGDFFQLPPVSKGKEVKFVFEADSWKNSIKKCVILHTQHRQSDSVFIEMLNNIRYGYLTKNTHKVLEECQKRDLGDKKRTCLFSHRLDAENFNKKELGKLISSEITYESCDVGVERYKASLKDSPAPEQLSLKVGALVMLLKNTQPEIGLVNGAVGVIVGFEEIKDKKHKEIKDKKDSYAQECNIRTAENAFYKEHTVYPSVQFDRVKATIAPDFWEIESGGLIVAARVQLPLTYAWGLSIHKSQGLTLPAAELNLEKVFEAGQAYVALSRLQSLDGLKIVGRIPGSTAWRVNTKVLDFYKKIDPHFKEVDPSELYFSSMTPPSSSSQQSGPTTLGVVGNKTIIKLPPALLKKYTK